MQLRDIEHIENLDMAQKAKVNWGIEGDENSKYFHASVNRKRRQVAIRGIMIDGEWVVNPNLVQVEFYNHFRSKISKDFGVRATITSENFKKLSLQQVVYLESQFSREEIKKVVWDYGYDKVPGPDGFTFGFFKRFWDLVKDDILKLVWYF